MYLRTFGIPVGGVLVAPWARIQAAFETIAIHAVTVLHTAFEGNRFEPALRGSDPRRSDKPLLHSTSLREALLAPQAATMPVQS